MVRTSPIKNVDDADKNTNDSKALVHTSPVKNVDDADKKTNDSEALADEETKDGASKTSSNAARVANLANLKKGRKGKKKRNGLAVVNAKKSVVAVAEPAPAPSSRYPNECRDKGSLAHLHGQHTQDTRRDL